MTFYFHNSYQQSPVGFQLSKINPDSDQLERIVEGDILPGEFRSLLINGGVTCAIGSANNIDYFVLHNISITDSESRQWYITLGFTANEASRATFERVIQKLFLDYSGFLAAVQYWFFATPEQPLSYDIHVAALREWMNGPAPNISKLPFYQASNPVVDQYRSMLEKLGRGIGRRLFLLVPESTVAYFFTQNKVFDRELPHFLFNAEEFYKLLQTDATLLDAEPKEAQKASVPIWDQLGITKEQFIQYVITGVIVCASFIGMAGHLVKRITKRH